ncbi:MAG TPA: hypothetical protein VE871_20050 [Longimicrobium sp.]|nr:hypothetical protein [Longimicrobium sp.]
MRLSALLLRAGLFAAVLPLAACGGDGSGPDRLSPDEVAGVYNLCELRFAPTNNVLPVANLLTAVVDTTPPAGRPEATISIANGVYDLVYTAGGNAFLRQLQGSVDYGATSVTLSTPEENVVVKELLLPTPLTLTFAAGTPRILATQTSFTYAVDREDYARAIGSSGQGLAATITGNAVIGMSTGPC